MARVAVIGAGASGLTTAVALAQRGHQVTVYEGGAPPTRSALQEPFTETLRRRLIQHQSGHPDGTVLVETSADSQVLPRAGWPFRQVGGGAAVWGGWAQLPSPGDFMLRTRMRAWGHRTRTSRFLAGVVDWPVSYDVMARWLGQARDLIGIEEPDRDCSRLPDLPAVAELAEWRMRAIPLAEAARARWRLQAPAPLRDLWPWRHYLLALRSGVQFRSHCRVVALDLGRRNDRVIAVRYRHRGSLVAEPRFDAYFLAGGAIQTVRLLLLSGYGHQATPSARLLGRFVMFHLFGPRLVTSGAAAHPMPAAASWRFRRIRVHDAGERTWLPGGFVSVHSRPLPPSDWLADHEDPSRTGLEVRFTGEDLPSWGNVIRLAPQLCDSLGLPLAHVRRRASLGSDAIYAQVARHLRRLANELTASRVRSSTFQDDWKRIGDHQLGGCRMGEDPRSSVTAPSGRIHDLANVYIVDASTFPTALSVPPTLVTVANALRIVDQF